MNREETITRIAAIVGLLLLIALLNLMGFGRSDGTVTIHNDFNNEVQMFALLRDGPDVGVSTVPNGTRCTRVDDITYKSGGDQHPMYFYKLTCAGHTGYINTQWVN